jgi:DNA invertase Pin-like site-specific DNA recombinase
VWVDNESAFKAVDRPEFDAAMSALAAVEVGALWCYALDRFTRKGAGAIAPVLDAGQRVVFDYEDLDSSRPRDRRWIIQRAEDAREYSERLAYNVKRTKERQRREGRWLGRAPFGLVCDGARKLRPDTEPWVSSVVSRRTYSRWDVLCRIFQMIAEGKSTRAAARELNAEGIPAPRTGRIDPAVRPSWRGSTIKYMVGNLAYEGWLTESSNGRRKPTAWRDDEGQRVCVAGHGVELIPAALAARARRSLHGTGATPKDPAKGRPKLLLTGLLRCEACGSGMTSGGDSYGCLRYHSGGDCPNPASIRRDHAEEYVSARWIAALNAADLEDAFLLAVAERYAALRHPEASADVVDAQEALRAARAELAAFEKEFSAGVYKRQRAMALSLREQLTEDVEAAQAAVSALTAPKVDVSEFVDGLAAKVWEGAEHNERRDLLRLAIDCIYVKRGKRGQAFDGDARMHVQWAGTSALELAA